MGAPTSLLGQARAFARDFPRDSMPQGYLWDVVDYVPLIIDAGLTGRGGWTWGSDVADQDFESGVLATFNSGDQLLVQSSSGQIYNVQLPPSTAISPRGTTTRSAQNPVQLADTVVSPDTAQGQSPAYWRDATVGQINAAHKHAKFATVYKSMLVTGNAPGETNVIRFSVPGKDLVSDPASYDDLSQYPTSRRITALAALRSAVLIFHTGSVERMRGTTPAHGTTGGGDMFLEPLFDRVGCNDPRTIAYWNDNCLFADEHGVHITDGATIRNLASQGGILYYWRTIWGGKVSAAACTFLDYYLITIRRSAGQTPVTLVCDLNRRQWFRFTNIDCPTFIASGGSTGMERIWGAIAGTKRLALMGPCFFPVFTTSLIADANGTTVLPTLETPWYRLAQEGRKRIRFAYLSYDVRTGAPLLRDDLPAQWRDLDELGNEHPRVAPAPKASTPILDVGYIRSPQQTTYVDLGQLPATSEYTRKRLALGQFPYGVGFKITQTAASTVTRLFDLAVEAQPAERSRV